MCVPARTLARRDAVIASTPGEQIMLTMFEIRIADADVMAFEGALAARLENPASILQAIGGQR